MRRGAVPLCAAVCLTVPTLVACTSNAPRGESALQRVRRTGVVRIGFANEAPFAYLDPKSGALTGEAPEVARAVLAALGVGEVRGVLTEFGSLIPGLKAGRFDLIAAGMYVTPARCAEIDFSEPTYSVGEAFLVRRGNPRDLHSYADVAADANVTLGVVAGAVERGYARDEGIPDERVVVFPDAPSAVAGLQARRIDAYAGTALTVRDLLAKLDSDELEEAHPFRDPQIGGRPRRGYGAFGFRRGDDDLRRAFNAELKKYLGTPQHESAVAPFGFTARELPGAVTTAELCSAGG